MLPHRVWRLAAGSAALLLAGLALPACAPIKLAEPPAPASRALPSNCDLASSDGLSFSRSEAARLAQKGLAANLADVKGDLVAAGYSRLRVISRRVVCRPYPLSPALKSCTATARVCGR